MKKLGLSTARNFSGSEYKDKSGKAQLLKITAKQDGYLVVRLSKESKSKIYLVHRLVVEAFLENPNNYPEVNHKDENPGNNNVSNLEWCDTNYNINYGTRNERAGKAISKAMKGNQCAAKAVICIELKLIFDSAKEAGEFIKVANISTNIRNNYKAKGYTFKYITIIEL